MSLTSQKFFGYVPRTDAEVRIARDAYQKLRKSRTANKVGAKLWTGAPMVNPMTGKPFPAAVMWGSEQLGALSDGIAAIKRTTPAGYVGHGGWISVEVSDAGGAAQRRLFRLGSEYPIILNLGRYGAAYVRVESIVSSLAPLNFAWLTDYGESAQQPAYPTPLWIHTDAGTSDAHFVPEGAIEVASNAPVILNWLDWASAPGGAVTTVNVNADARYEVRGSRFTVDRPCQLTFYVAAL